MKNEIQVNSPVVPDNETGKAVDLEEAVTENSMEEAITTFKRACKRLLNPSVWHELSGALSASFTLAAPGDPSPHRLARADDFFKIDIPGPGPSSGDGYDWVQVESITEQADPSAEESFGMTLKVAANPEKPGDGTAHFFKEGATSSFIIKRNGTTVTASYHGRNEQPNIKDAKPGDKIRNTIIAIGAMIGISELQWKSLIKGFLQKEIGG
ncbi:MAG: hypothetical protein H7Y01_13760 [Ferruginibacter sp.]|nr:hypothetical protein [Chitinophagaceae bacterium]